MKTNNNFVLVVSLLVALCLAGCSSETNKGGSAKIISITPEPVPALCVGQKVNMSAVVEYTLNGKQGKIDLAVQTKDGKSVGALKEPSWLEKSSGVITLLKSFEVPDTTELHIRITMYAGESSSMTKIVDTRVYNIAPRVIEPPNVWDVANSKVKRLLPSAFPELPISIKEDLSERQCTVPQTFASTQPHNVIQGEFAQKGQKDWAVLCSTGQVSTILIFWGGSTKEVSSIYSSLDRSYLQGIGGDEIGYSQEIFTVGREHILEHYKAHGGPTPPPIDHDGIEHSFVEKASTVLYYHKKEWLSLTGAD
ncbi:MAG: hypothetical protein AUJ51_04395 [Elusimicrobia bacterium CG1_02_56_21]|nr:MAG: hypothetical protein AUJ51_04395 [Elusimicrobia bacterium CG1_02_56_21]